MKKRIFAILMALLMIFAVGCGKAQQEPEAEPVANMANPFEDFETQADAEKAAGFSINILDGVDDAEPVVYRVNKSINMIEVIYANGDAEALRIRKALGTDPIDGDYNEYQSNVVEEIAGVNATVRGEEGSTHVVTWTQNVGGTDYSYAITSDAGFDDITVKMLIGAVKD